MPPLRTYIFKHQISSSITITLEVFGDEDKAWRNLSSFGINTNDWILNN